jgi:hypothetical protein
LSTAYSLNTGFPLQWSLHTAYTDGVLLQFAIWQYMLVHASLSSRCVCHVFACHLCFRWATLRTWEEPWLECCWCGCSARFLTQTQNDNNMLHNSIFFLDPSTNQLLQLSEAHAGQSAVLQQQQQQQQQLLSRPAGRLLV